LEAKTFKMIRIGKRVDSEVFTTVLQLQTTHPIQIHKWSIKVNSYCHAAGKPKCINGVPGADTDIDMEFQNSEVVENQNDQLCKCHILNKATFIVVFFNQLATYSFSHCTHHHCP